MKEKIIITSYKLYKKEEKDLQKNIKKKIAHPHISLDISFPSPTHVFPLSTMHF